MSPIESCQHSLPQEENTAVIHLDVTKLINSD